MADLTDQEIRAFLDEQERGGKVADVDEAVEREAQRLRRSRAAKRLVDHEDAERDFVLPPSERTLAEEMALQDLPLQYSVADLHPAGGNTLLGAAFKAGKTTLLANLFRSLLDDEPFLGRYSVEAAPGRVAYWNYEVTGQQFRTWMRLVGIRNQEEGAVWNLRGHRMDLTVPFIEDQAVAWLAERQVGTLIIDPYSRAYRGEENNNTEVGRFLEGLDVIKERSGVVDLFVAAHFGRGDQEEGSERVRGATRLDDWADVRWLLTKGTGEDSQRRYFKAEGRDVYVPEHGLKFDPASLALSVDGGSRSEERTQKKGQALRERVLEVIAAKPGIGAVELRGELTGKNTDRDNAVKALLNARQIRVVKEGKSAKHYLVGGDSVPGDSASKAGTA